LLARAINAKTIVEFGTSFGVSTIYLATAIRDNGNGGKVIGTEFVPGKVKEAKKNLEAAGLLRYADIWEGDARQTLKKLPDYIDLCLMDGFPPYALDVFKLIAPHMRKGGMVITDGTEMLKDVMGDYLKYLRDPANGFRTLSIPIGDGTEISVKV
jgi:predicted O-methyltransferase YrrM